ncbi:MAG: hypothetical protein UV82_C0005G0002 [Candidatus Magasanikbacteria bacterium GW2011_GWD2_43_18]|nr:MAG: hypothetical protein UV18_C0005G0184 [Candidatus Magasanikbacteria bacterium GW2011_GWC2_42_27]KKT04764.1 MAG: hypothetical protein UV82_C0005G0002 [Candidatus Magasanikbacteria bacterium GW2011_GWD2_43_18]KKT25879.1 MAG: hypothetical protein UW10_C0003G0040 [Candidatus Magasanikbacteria bacterium GW2011_GWA2_43_9]
MMDTTKKKNLGFFLLRLSVGLIFIVQGWGKLNGVDMVSGMLDGIGFPAPGFFAWILALTEFLGGIAVILGLFVRHAATLLAVVMVVALFTVHIPGPFAQAMTPVALLGSTLALMLLGGGDWQVMKEKN